MPYRQWYQSDHGEGLRWIFRTPSSLAYFLREKKARLIEDGLIEVIPTRGYFIIPDKFTAESIKPLFFAGV
jgi:hypothetical protein